MVVGTFLGINIMITVSLVLENTKGEHQQAATKGLLIGFVTMPFGCVITEWIAGFKTGLILANPWPVLCVALSLLILFKVCGDHILMVFKGLSFMALLQRPLRKLGTLLKINGRSVISLLICAANPIPVMLDRKRFVLYLWTFFL